MESTVLATSELLAGIGHFVDTIWELDLNTRRIYVWHDTVMTHMVHQSLDFQETILGFYHNYVYKPDKQKWLDAYTMENLYAFLESGEKTRSFDIRVNGGPFGFAWHEVTWNALPGENGGHDRVLLCTKNRMAERQAAIVERAVRNEYDYVVYIEVPTNSYIMYMGNMENGTPLPPEVGEDYEQEIFAYNLQYVHPAFLEQLNAKMHLARVAEELEKKEEYVIYSKMVEQNETRDKKLCFRYYDQAHTVLLLTRVDITEILEDERQKKLLRDALEAAEVANRAKSEFLSRMSHDIRTPMNAIIGLTAIAGTHARDPERVLDCLQKISGASKLLLSLINEVLDMSKIESGRISLSQEPFALSRLFEDLLLIIRPDVDQKGHRLDIHLEHIEHENVVGDIQRIQQVLMNLLTNAVKYTPEGGHIVVSLAERPSNLGGYGCFEFVVEDNGIGVDAEFLPRIFEPFERADSTEVRAVQGTGLGMAISRNLAQMMNGDILVESVPGKGSRFTATVYLNLGVQALPEVKVLADLPILLADDDPVVCEEATACLSGIGMSCTSVYTGGEAVRLTAEAYLAGRGFFALLLDLRLPDMSGIEVIRQVRAQVGGDVPVVIITAYDSAEFELEARRAGADGFLSKPLFPSKLLYLLRKLAMRETPEEAEPDVHQTREEYAGRRVLLVEDNALNREIALELIGDYGVILETAENGRIAVQKVQSSPVGWYSMVFMDVQMPVMNGYEATRAIRILERPDARQVPIVAMTANAFAEDVARAVESGMNDHMAKPIDLRQLEEILKRYLG